MEKTVEVVMTLNEALLLQHMLNAVAMNNNESKNKTYEDLIRLSLKITHALLKTYIGGRDGKG